MNTFKTGIAAATLALSAGSMLVATTGVAQAADTRDTKTTSGSCSGQADYSYRLRDYGSDDSSVRVAFEIDSNKEDRDWTVKVYRNGHQVRTLHETTGSKGDATLYTDFVADDDATIKIYAKAGYGEHCQDTLRLDSADN